MFSIPVPSLGESIFEATVSRWHKSVGDFVKMDEILLELETEKVTLEVFAPENGILETIHLPAGSTAHVGESLGEIRLEEIRENTPPLRGAPDPKETFSPSVERLIFEHGLDPYKIPCKDPKGRLTKEDVLAYLPKAKSIPVLEKKQNMERVYSQPQNSSRLEERIPLSRLRKTIAQRLKQAQNTSVILTTFNEIDMSSIMALRKTYKDSFEKKYGVRLGFMSFFTHAVVRALKEIPILNAAIDEEDVISRNYYDIGVAVSAPQGLVVPVLRDADQMRLADIECHIEAFGKKAKEGTMSMEEMRGGTFTISNGGVFGSLLSTPILNPPQSGILGLHKIQERPIAHQGQVVIRPMMYVALSYDHRLIDGREAVMFLAKIKDLIEQPGSFLLDL